MTRQLGLKENQIYKWFWDTKKKAEEDNQIALQIGKQLKTEGGFKNVNAPTVVQGIDGRGNRITPQQIKTALKANKNAAEKEDDIEPLAIELGLDVEKLAQELVDASSPKGTRIVVRQVIYQEPAK